MVKLVRYEMMHKSTWFGLCKSFGPMFFLLFFLLVSSCGKDDPITAEEETTEDTDTEQTDDTEDSGVTILSESDVVDFDKFYKPQDLASNDMLRSDSQWSFVRSAQSEHFFVFWEKGFGDDPNGNDVPSGLRVDIDDLLAKAESFYAINVNTLGFATVGSGQSNLDKYKMEIYLLYQTEWLATGSGYDNVIGALWVNPSTCQPVGSTIAHEIGHSFQYQVYADLLAYGGISDDYTRGFRYGFGGNGGNAFWEQCAQWQSFQSYPAEAFESYNFGVYMDNYHRHFNHEWQRYASYFLQYYLTDKYGIDYIGKLWREAVSPEDPLEVYMRLEGLTTDELNSNLYEAVSHLVTWDFDAIRSYGQNYIGKYSYKFYQLSDGSYQVAYAKCPGTSGFNVIPLNVPDAGTVVSSKFTAIEPGSALAAGDPGEYTKSDETYTTTTYNSSSITRAGWRYGYVALLTDGTRVYGEMNKKTSAEVGFTIPENCERLWFVVLGAPTTYSSHAWDEDESNDDQWPYKVQFTNTDLLGNITIDPNATPEDLTLTYDLAFSADADAYSGTTVNLTDNGDLTKVAQALAMQPSDITSVLLAAKAEPSEGKIAFAAVEPDGTLNYSTTANGLGFWFDSNGAVISWSSSNDSKVFSEFSSGSFEFTIGQFPGKSSAGDKYTIKEAFVYTKDGTQYKVIFVFNVTIQ